MQLAVLSRPTSWYFQDLARAAGDRHRLVPLSYRELAATTQTGALSFQSGALPLDGFDALLARSMPAGSLEQIIFRMDVLGQLHAQGVPIINPPRALETAVDKYLTTARLAAAGLPVPRTIACQGVEQLGAAFEQLGRDVVLKPLFGSEGRGISRFQDPDLLRHAAGLLTQLGGVLYLQEYLPHEGFDLRVLLIGERAFAIRRSNPLDWRTNLSRGGSAERIELAPAWLELARRAAAAVGAPVAGVDLLPARDGTVYVLEVNAVPGWRGLAAVHEVDIAAEVLKFVAQQVRNE